MLLWLLFIEWLLRFNNFFCLFFLPLPRLFFLIHWWKYLKSFIKCEWLFDCRWLTTRMFFWWSVNLCRMKKIIAVATAAVKMQFKLTECGFSVLWHCYFFFFFPMRVSFEVSRKYDLLSGLFSLEIPLLMCKKVELLIENPLLIPGFVFFQRWRSFVSMCWIRWKVTWNFVVLKLLISGYLSLTDF